MHAVIRTGGKQYRVAEGDVLRVEKLAAEAGSKIELGEVLMVTDGDDVRIGSPLVDGVKVTAEVQAHGRGKKIDVIKFKRRKKYRRKYGHRQDYTELKVTGIAAGKGGAKKTAAKAEKADDGAAAAAKETPKKAAPKKAAPKKAAPKKAAPKKAEAGKSSGGAAKSPAKKATTAKSKAKSEPKKTAAGTTKKAAPKRTTAKKESAGKSEKKGDSE